jgi:hypothetical protein
VSSHLVFLLVFDGDVMDRMMNVQEWTVPLVVGSVLGTEVNPDLGLLSARLVECRPTHAINQVCTSYNAKRNSFRK